VEENLIEYEALMMIAKNGGCCQCGFYPANRVEKITDQGLKDLLQCPECGEIMRPYCPENKSGTPRRVIDFSRCEPHE